MRSSTASRAVRIRTGDQVPCSRRRLHVSIPLIPGSITSSTIASYSVALARTIASSPLPATSTARPSSVSPRRSSAAILSSSSTTSTLTGSHLPLTCCGLHKARLGLRLLPHRLRRARSRALARPLGRGHRLPALERGPARGALRGRLVGLERAAVGRLLRLDGRGPGGARVRRRARRHGHLPVEHV